MPGSGSGRTAAPGARGAGVGGAVAWGGAGGRRRCSRGPSGELRPSGPDPAAPRRASAAADKGACRWEARPILRPPGGSGHRQARPAPPPPARPVPPLGPAGPVSGMEPPPLLLPLALLALLWGGERGAVALPAGCKHDGRARGTGRAAGAEGKVVCSSLELAQVLPPDTLPNRTVTL